MNPHMIFAALAIDYYAKTVIVLFGFMMLLLSRGFYVPALIVMWHLPLAQCECRRTHVFLLGLSPLPALNLRGAEPRSQVTLHRPPVQHYATLRTQHHPLQMR